MRAILIVGLLIVGCGNVGMPPGGEIDDMGGAALADLAPAPADMQRIARGESCEVPDGSIIACCPVGTPPEECPITACAQPTDLPDGATAQMGCCFGHKCCAVYQVQGPTHPIAYEDCGDGWKCISGCTP